MKIELTYPLLHRRWKWLAYLLFPFPFIFLIIAVLIPFEFPQDAVGDFIYLCWALAFGIFNFSREKEEDEMIEQIRLKSFAMGVYYLIWGLIPLAIFQVVAEGSIFTDYMSAYLAVFLLNVYIFFSFQYNKWKNS